MRQFMNKAQNLTKDNFTQKIHPTISKTNLFNNLQIIQTTQIKKINFFFQNYEVANHQILMEI